MIDYKKYKKAEIIELDEYQSPENGKFFYISSFDDLEIRVGVWENIKKQAKIKGTIVLQNPLLPHGLVLGEPLASSLHQLQHPVAHVLHHPHPWRYQARRPKQCCSRCCCVGVTG